MTDFHAFKRSFDPLFQEYLEQALFPDMPGVPVFDETQEMIDHLKLLVGTGKRIRPFITQLVCNSHGGSHTRELEHCMHAIELFHAFALIHDDSIDDSGTRHGVESFHIKFSAAHAILVGDLCFARAAECMNDDSVTPIPRMLFNKLSTETIAGQLGELHAQGRSDLTCEELGKIAEYKTARYTFTYPMLIGLAISGDLGASRTYALLGDMLGTVYQRIDDLADIFLDAGVLGKSPCTDIVRGVSTHIACRLREALPVSERACIDGYRSKILSSADIDAIRTLVRKSGCLVSEVSEIHAILHEAEKCIETLNIPDDCRASWKAMLSSMEDPLDSL